MNKLRWLWRECWIGWHQGAISRHQRLLAKYDPDREMREYRAHLATSPAAQRVRARSTQNNISTFASPSVTDD